MTTLRTLATAALALLPLSAGASVDQLIQPGPAGEDAAPYSFLPTLPRGERDTNWAFTASDAGVDHSFRTFVRFPLPAPPADHSVAYAYIWFYYAFDASGFGETEAAPAEVHCHEVLADWSEPALTWLNQPPIGAAFDVWSGISGPQLFFCDVTQLAREWIAAAKPNNGIAITNPTGRTIGMHSFESTLAPSDSYKPSLLIGYEPSAHIDSDGDGIFDATDICPLVADPGQEDAERDGVGDACDVCPTAFDPGQEDADGDGEGDRCGFAAADLDGDGFVAGFDEAAFGAALGTVASDADFDLRCDLDADASVTSADRALWLPIYRAHYTGYLNRACGLLGIEVPLILGAAAALRRLCRRR